MSSKRTLLSGASIVTAAEVWQGTLLINGERIEKLWHPNRNGMVKTDNGLSLLSGIEDSMVSEGAERIDLHGKTVMAGAIDAHVHFREPGMTWKADIESESRAALLGGVTSFIDMPNTMPPAVSLEEIEHKCRLASGRSWANYGFHIGADNGNSAELRRLLSEGKGNTFAGIKVFMGSSTGDMIVNDRNALEYIFSIPGVEILIHSEDESIIRANMEKALTRFGDSIPTPEHSAIRSRQACIRSTITALELAMKYGTRLHVLHVTTAEEVEMIRTAKMYNPRITAETSANYLWFCDEDYERLGSRLKCNPSVKTSRDRAALRKALKDGIIDTVGSDHAPHLVSEKDRPYTSCPSGMPSIQQALSVLLSVAYKDDIPLQTIASAISEKAAAMFGVEGRGVLKEGNIADITVIDPDIEFTVGKANPHSEGETSNSRTPSGAAGISSKCGWSPYEGERLRGMATDVFIAGRHVMAGGRIIDNVPHGQRLTFSK